MCKTSFKSIFANFNLSAQMKQVLKKEFLVYLRGASVMVI
jgi:hypothetical protein